MSNDHVHQVSNLTARCHGKFPQFLLNQLDIYVPWCQINKKGNLTSAPFIFMANERKDPQAINQYLANLP